MTENDDDKHLNDIISNLNVCNETMEERSTSNEGFSYVERNERTEDNESTEGNDETNETIPNFPVNPETIASEESNDFYDHFDGYNRGPSVDWIYPSDDDDDGNRDRDEETSIDYVVDPNDVEVTLSVEGVVVPKRLCFLKICGFVVCDDGNAFLLNSKIFAFVFGALVVIGVIGTPFLVQKDISSIDVQNTDTAQTPSEIIPEKSAVTDPRITNITQNILEISGNILFEKNSTQNKALNWILFDDELELDHDSSNLLQRYGLMVFFYNLHGESWFQNDNYGSGRHECEWYGISCVTINGVKHVDSLVLEKNGLKGQIPKEISILTRLTRLQLQGNAISGSIPSSVGQLKKLEKLYLDFNRLTGTIPVEIINCISMKRIIVNNNMISGSIPEFDNKLRFLSDLFFQENRLSGTIPSSIGNLDALQLLLLSSNRLTNTIPQELENAKNLKNLNVEENNLTGEIPSSLAGLSDLTKLNLSHNTLSGVIPTVLYQLPEIMEFTLNDNVLTGTIPNVSDFLPRAKQILLHNNLINGTIPENLGDLTKLTRLSLHSSMLSGTVPHSLCGRQLQLLTADCEGENSKVLCSCCTKCF